MNIIGQCLTRDEFTEYVATKNFGTLPANKLVIHHTWRPTKESWAGEPTLFAIKRYYERKGWNAGPHLFVAEDGIWLFTDMAKDGIHAGAGNHRSIGIEVVGDYNNQVWEGETKLNALHVIITLLKRLGLDSSRQLLFHRDFSTKTCPGTAITKDWLYKELTNFKPMSIKEKLLANYKAQGSERVQQIAVMEELLTLHKTLGERLDQMQESINDQSALRAAEKQIIDSLTI